MKVNGQALADELRRRKVGRPALLVRLDRSERSAYVPGDLGAVPTGLLVLAAMSVASVTEGATPRG